jgi:hypothetical protein
MLTKTTDPYIILQTPFNMIQYSNDANRNIMLTLEPKSLVLAILEAHALA